MTPDPILSLQEIHKHYDTPAGSGQIRVLNNLSFSVQAGQAISIVGPSGSGKSTLLNLMGLLDRPTSGTVLFNNKPVAALKEQALATLRNRDIGFVFQLHHLLPQCSVLENILLPALPALSRKQTMPLDYAHELLESTGLASRQNHRPPELSGGEQLRTAIARALINRPSLLLADEPTGSLDHKTAREITNLLLRLNRTQKLALVVVTHATEVANAMDLQFELKDGALVQS